MESDQGSKTPNDTRRRKGGVKRIVGIGLLLVVLAMGGLIAGAPSLLSTDSGRDWLVGRINGQIKGDLTVASLDLSWASGQRIEGLELRHDGELVLSAERVLASSATAWNLVRGDYSSLGEIRIVKPVIDAEMGRDGKLNVLEALSSTRPVSEREERDGAALADLSAQVAIEDGRLSLRIEDVGEVQSALALRMLIDDGRLRTEKRQELRLQPTAEAVAGLLNRLGEDVPAELRSLRSGEVGEVVVSLDELAVPLAGEGKGFDARSAQLAGEIRLVEGKSGQALALAGATVRQLQVKFRTENGRLIVSPGEVLRLEPTATLVNGLVDRWREDLPEAFREARVSEVGELSVEVTSFSMPLPGPGEALDFEAMQVGGMVRGSSRKAGDLLALTGAQRVEGLRLAHLHLVVPEGDLAEGMMVQVSGQLRGKGLDGSDWRASLTGQVGQERVLNGDLVPRVELALTPVPMALADQLAGQEGLIVRRLGEEWATLQFHLRYDMLSQAMAYRLLVPGDDNQVDISGTYDEERMTVGGSASLRVYGDDGQARKASFTTKTTLLSPGELAKAEGIAVVRQVLTDSRLEQFPADLADALLGLEGRLVSAVGASGLVTLERDREGRIRFRFESSRATIPIEMTLGEDGELVLTKDTSATFALTVPLSQAYLRFLHPFLSTAVAADGPVQIKLKQGMALHPAAFGSFDAFLKNADIEAEIDLGRVSMRNDGLVSVLLQAFRPFQGVSFGSRLGVEVTPIRLRLSKGTLRYEPFEMRIDGMPITTSGEVNLLDEQYRLSIGISADALRQFKGMDKVLRQGYSISVPLRGPFENPEFDTQRMVQEFTRLAIQAGLRSAIGDALPGRKDENREEDPADGDQDGEDREEENADENKPRKPQPGEILIDFIRIIQEQQRREREKKEQENQEEKDGGSGG